MTLALLSSWAPSLVTYHSFHQQGLYWCLRFHPEKVDWEEESSGKTSQTSNGPQMLLSRILWSPETCNY